MKIAFINLYQNAVKRGAENFVLELSKRLAKIHKVKVFAFSVKPKKRWPIVWRFFLDPFGFQTFWYSLKVLPSLFKEKFDIVIPVNGGWQPALVRLATWLYKGKMVISGQSGIGWDDINNLWCFPDCFVALTSYQKVWAKKVNPFIRVITIPNGVDLKKFGKKEKLDINLEKPIILSVGALTEIKRQDLAIKAVSRLKKGSLLLVGEGEKKDKLLSLGEKLLGKRFMIKSYIYTDMPKVYKSADVFTYPTSSFESFGIVLLEAMASGLPVVATNDPIRKEIVGNAGILVNPENIDEYAKALKNALKKKPVGKIRKQVKKFDWKIVSKSYDKLFQTLRK